MDTLERYQPRSFADCWFIIDDRFQRFFHAGTYEEAVMHCKALNEIPEAIPTDPSTRPGTGKLWMGHPREHGK